MDNSPGLRCIFTKVKEQGSHQSSRGVLVQMDKVSISFVRVLSTWLSLGVSLKVLDYPLPNLKVVVSAPLKQQPPVRLLSSLVANRRRHWGRGIRPSDWPPRAPPRPGSRELSGRLGADPAAAHGP